MTSPPEQQPREPRVLPCELPFEHLDLPALGGHIGPLPEDFRVDEIPLYAASGQGDHWYVRVEKRERTTLELCEVLAAAAGTSEREIGYAGMKDKHAVTTQWLSVPVPRAVAPDAWQLPEGYRVLEVTRHSNKLRMGHLAANRFQIRLVGVAAGAEASAPALCERVARAGIGNAFGPQRFGLGQRNLDNALFALARRRLEPRGGKRAKFFGSVIQSELFNRYLVARLAGGRDRVVAGDVVRLEGSRSVFVVEDVEREQPRLEAGDIHLTGPMLGPKMKEPSGWPRELELSAVRSLDLSEEALAALGRIAPGTRRDLLLRPRDFEHEALADGALRLAFTLPAGSYASVVVRNLTRHTELYGAEREGDVVD